MVEADDDGNPQDLDPEFMVRGYFAPQLPILVFFC